MKNFMLAGVVALGLTISPLQGSAMRALSVGSLATSAALFGKSIYRVHKGSSLVRNELIAASAALVTGFFSWHLATDQAEEAKKAATVKAPDVVLPKLAEEKAKAETEAQDLKRQLGEVRTEAERAKKAAQAAQKAAEDKANLSDAEAKRLDAARLAAEKQLKEELARRAGDARELQAGANRIRELVINDGQQKKRFAAARMRLAVRLTQVVQERDAEKKQVEELKQAAALVAEEEAAQAEAAEDGEGDAAEAEEAADEPVEPVVELAEEEKKAAAEQEEAPQEEQEAPARRAGYRAAQRARKAAADAAEQKRLAEEKTAAADERVAGAERASDELIIGVGRGIKKAAAPLGRGIAATSSMLWNSGKKVASTTGGWASRAFSGFKSGLSRGL